MTAAPVTVTGQTLPFVGTPTLPPSWERDRMDHHAWTLWALAYGRRYADLCEEDDRRIGITVSLSAAARESRVKAGARAAMMHRIVTLEDRS